MNQTRLRIYLEDHLALIVGELELIERCHHSNQQSDLGRFLSQFQGEVSRQRATVDTLLSRLGRGPSIQGEVKQAAAWLAEKFGRLKMNDSFLEYSPLSRVVELESMMAATFGRMALWATLDTVIGAQSQFAEFAFGSMREQAERQIQDLTGHHRSAIHVAFAGG